MLTKIFSCCILQNILGKIGIPSYLKPSPLAIAITFSLWFIINCLDENVWFLREKRYYSELAAGFESWNENAY